jgi:hypothetical protein
MRVDCLWALTAKGGIRRPTQSRPNETTIRRTIPTLNRPEDPPHSYVKYVAPIRGASVLRGAARGLSFGEITQLDECNSKSGLEH